jgi:hypothetical protein
VTFYTQIVPVIFEPPCTLYNNVLLYCYILHYIITFTLCNCILLYYVVYYMFMLLYYVIYYTIFVLLCYVIIYFVIIKISLIMAQEN